MPAQLANGGPPRRAFAASSSQDYEEGHFQQHTGHGAPGSGWQDGSSGDAFLGGSAGKSTGSSGTGLANGLEKRGSAAARRPSAPPAPPTNLPFNSFASHRRPASPQAGSSAGPFGSLLAFAGGVRNGLISSSSTGLVGNVKCATASDGLLRPRVLTLTSYRPRPSLVVSLCCLWYFSSALSSNTGKSIFNAFKFPVTLTLIQFAIIALYCFIYTRPALQLGTLREPTKALLRGVLPMAGFQVGGHVFSSVATSRVPVATVHTIKVGQASRRDSECRRLMTLFSSTLQALSPLFTVLSYRFLFGVSYSASTYIALVPLTLGVMFACSFDVSASNYFGLVCAFGSTLVFVSSNIFFKKIVPSTTGASAGHKDASAGTNQRLDKINLLFYSSSLAFLFMVPLWLYSDLGPIVRDMRIRASQVPHPPPRTAHLLYYFFLNGTSHFLQNVLAFNILSSTSPVTYSIASLVKRIFVIVMAIVWFRQKVHVIQGLCVRCHVNPASRFQELTTSSRPAVALA